MITVLRYLVLSILLISVNTSIADMSAATDLSVIAKDQWINPNRILYENQGDLSVEALRNTEAQLQGKVQNNPVASLPKSVEGHWLKYQFYGLNQLSNDLLLRIDYPQLDEVDFYTFADNKLIEAIHTGDKRLYNSRPIDNRVFVFPIHRYREHSSIEVYIRIKTEGMKIAPIEILGEEAFETQQVHNHLFVGGWFSIVFIMFIYNFLIYLVIRDNSYLFYLLFVFTNASVQYALMGYGFALSWPNHPELNNSIVATLTTMLPLTAVIFVSQFLSVREVGKGWEKVALNLLILLFGLNAFNGWWGDYGLTLAITQTAALIAICAGFYIGISYWRRGHNAARNFALAWFAYLVFAVIYILGVGGYIEFSFVVANALPIGSIIELTLLSLAFADKINDEKTLRLNAQENALAAQQKLSYRLDSLVKERTQELESVNQKLLRLSITDELSGLNNRRHFEETFSLEFRRHKRSRSSLSVLMLDIDHFKHVNDTYGHQFGDQCIRTVAQCITDNIRRPPDLAARYGGEEFICMLPDTSLEGALQLAERMRQSVENIALIYCDETVSITASFGVATMDPDMEITEDGFLKLVDDCLYQAKHKGRNRVEWELGSSEN